MKINFYRVLSVCMFLSFICDIFAVPAKPGVMQYEMPDGRKINVRLVGDEFCHQYLTEDGYPLIEEKGYLYYGDIDKSGKEINSGILAGNVDSRSTDAWNFVNKVNLEEFSDRFMTKATNSPRCRNHVIPLNAQKLNSNRVSESAGPTYEQGYGLYPGASFPAYGSPRVLVILVEYQDTKFRNFYDPYEYFYNMLNSEDFTDYKATGSALQYFKDNSNGVFTPQFDLYGPLTLDHDYLYYGENDRYGDDIRAHEMIIEACRQLDDVIDFNDYDCDGDGIVDNVYVFYAGRGEASGGTSGTVWPHSWELSSAGIDDLILDGVRVERYACSNELDGSYPDGIGTFVHEFGHVLGLPDIYQTGGYVTCFTPGDWCIMDQGSYNNDSRTPPNYGAFERYALGWIKPIEYDAPMSVTLPAIDRNECGIIRTEKDTEFFLFENRQKEGWDKYVPGHGMLVWHISYNSLLWEQNQVNNTPSFQCVDIVEADNILDGPTRSGDSFPGTANITSFTPETIPALVSWGGENLNYPITEIAEKDGLITFNVLGGSASVNEIIDMEDKGIIYYDLHGREVKNPSSGIYIKRQGQKIEKIILK